MIFFPFYVPWAICFYHLWCLLNKNKHRNSTVASTSPLRLSLSHLSSMLLSYINQSGHLCIGPLHNGNCMCRLQWLTGSCVLLAHAFMPSSYVWGDAEPGCVQKCGFKKTNKKNKTVSWRLTGWVLESFGRVDDHMQKAVQARSLLIWKTRTVQLGQFLVSIWW